MSQEIETARQTDLHDDPGLQEVMVCYALPDRLWLKSILISPRACVREIVEQSGFFIEHPDVLSGTLSYGVYGKKVSVQDRVAPGDRIEIYRPLTFDPKESRRRRAAHRAAKNKRRLSLNRTP